MGIREALRSVLLDVPEVEELVVVGAETRIYPQKLTQGSGLPAIVYQRISTRRSHSHDDGPGKGKLARPRIQLTCWAETPDGAEELADRVVEGLDGVKVTSEGVRIDAVLVENDIDLPDPITGHFRRVVDVFVWHAE